MIKKKILKLTWLKGIIVVVLIILFRYLWKRNIMIGPNPPLTIFDILRGISYLLIAYFILMIIYTITNKQQKIKSKTKKRVIAFFLLLTMIFSVFLFNNAFVSAQTGQISYCCEKTKSGAWCQNAPQESCDDNFRKAPTSCDATSYCRLGCCYDSQEGTCMENSPQKVCEDSNGVWANNAKCEIPQCNLGCCVLADQAAFVTQVRCKRLSALYGLETDFRTDIQSEMQCIASVSPETKGACVFEKDFERTCKFITKKECEDMGAKASGEVNASASNEVSFYEKYLCSDESLGTNCGPTEQTTCVEEKDEVYFVDSCGNLANIYDASKIKDKHYWARVYGKEESCSYGQSNANSPSCGNCDYYIGSTCKKFSIGQDRIKPAYGDKICRDLSCQYEGEKYQHGETWCADAKGTSKITPVSEPGEASSENLPGSRYFRLVCYNNEVNVEPCADFRQEVCIQSDINGFRTSACRVNMWQDCYSQNNQLDCENEDKRDCRWIGGVELNTLLSEETTSQQKTPAFRGTEQQPGQPAFQGTEGGTSSQTNIAGTTGSSITGGAIFGDDDKDEDDDEEGACVPKYAPGFNFWEAGDAQGICSMANAQCVVEYEKKIIGGKKCVKNCECLEDSWGEEMNQLCISLGDCGSKTNYLGIEGYHKGYAIKSEEEKEEEKKKE